MTTSRENPVTRNHDAFIRKKLLDLDFAREYVIATLEEKNEDGVTPEIYLSTLLHSLEQVVMAHGGPRKFIKKFNVNLHHSTLYNMFKYDGKRKGGPEFTTVWAVVEAIGVKLAA